MRDFNRRCLGPLADGLGLILLLSVLVLVVIYFSMFGAFLLDDTLHGHVADWRATRPGLELVIVPLAACVAARQRFLESRLKSFRESGVGPYLALLMAATLAGLCAFLAWSWRTPLTTLGPDDFGIVRWLGTALAAGFTIIWLPLFPRVTATLAGMIGGPALFAVIGYTFLGSHMQIEYVGSDSVLSPAITFMLYAMPVWIVGAFGLSHWTRNGEVVKHGVHWSGHAVWSGAVMLCLALLGVTYEHLY